MASLNLSTNGPSIKSSYQAVVNGSLPPSGSPTHALWALFSVQAPLVNAFQGTSAKESILKVQSTGEGELAELIEDLNDGRIQFAFVKVKDTNSGLPKSVLVAWCGDGVPERTKGYFTSHLAAVSNVLHGYHVQITARSESDVAPEAIIQKVADASGAKYSAGSRSDMPAPAPPPIASKPVFTPTSFGAGPSRVSPLVAARSKKDAAVDADGWGTDAPQISRTQLEKVESAYKPTRVNMSDLVGQKQERSGPDGGRRTDDRAGDRTDDQAGQDVVRGGYQPVGKVDIAAIRAQARQANADKPVPVKGAYEPVGKVDIAAIRAKAQPPRGESRESEPAPDAVNQRAALFTQPAEAQAERVTVMPKPKPVNKFGSAAFSGTKPPTPAALGFSGPSAPAPPPVGVAGRTFADHGGKTPAQLWAEKKAQEKGAAGLVSPTSPTPPTANTQQGGAWKSGYKGKSWAPVLAAGYGRVVPDQDDQDGQSAAGEGGEAEPVDGSEAPPPGPGPRAVSAIRDRFKDSRPIGVPPPHSPAGIHDDTGGRAMAAPLPPPTRPPVPDADEDDAAYEPAPAPAVHEERDISPARHAISGGHEHEAISPAAPPNRHQPSPIPTLKVEEPEPQQREEDPATYGTEPYHETEHEAADAGNDHAAPPSHAGGGNRARVQYDYEKAEDNEVELRAGDLVTDIDMVDADWWLGTNSSGERGLFPSNYVELEDEDAQAETAAGAPQHPQPEEEHEPVHQQQQQAAALSPTQAAAGGAGAEPAGQTATALFDYEAAEDNELSFPDGATVTNVEFPDEDWWYGHYGGKSGLFPANYVQLDS